MSAAVCPLGKHCTFSATSFRSRFTERSFGPTFVALILLSGKATGRWDLIYLSLNPFEQTLTQLRETDEKEIHLPSIIRQHGLGLTGTPTFLLFGHFHEQEIQTSIEQIALASYNFSSAVDLLRQFRGNPWDRISQEIEQRGTLARSRSELKHKASTQDIADYVSLIFDPKNFQEEINAFNAAWTDSIDIQRSRGNDEIAATAMPMTEMTRAVNILLKEAVG